jgi:membrane-associated phospholipid phosphatase
MSVRALFVLLALAASVGRVDAAEPLTDKQQGVEDAATVLKYAIPAVALLATFIVEPDAPRGEEGQRPGILSMGGSPRHDLFLALGRTAVVTWGLKEVTDETRPNGEPDSFPSGHTSIVFAGAEFLRKQYGWSWGVPAYLAAGFVGWSRVYTDHHYTHDVIAGAAIGILSNHDFWERNTSAGKLRLSTATLHSGRSMAPGLRFELRR